VLACTGYEPNYANLEFRIIKPELGPNIRNSNYMEFQNNQQGLPGKMRRQKIIARFTTKLYTVFVYSLPQQLWISNCRKSNKYLYVAYKIRIKRGRLPGVLAYIEAKHNISHSTKFSELLCHFQTYKCLLSPMNGIGIC